jgi:tRNA-dihydrouridine synthase B
MDYQLKDKAISPIEPRIEQCLPVMRPAPVRIGDVTVSPPLFLAPMAGVTDDIYRSIAASYGAGLVTTEMVSVAGLVRGQRETLRLCTQTSPLDVPLSVQIFGADPYLAAEAARRLEDGGLAILDINAGCPVKKVARQGAGAALLNDPDRLALLVEKVKRAVRIPVTVKIRSGWESAGQAIIELARRLESAGADAIAVHGRTAVQGFRGRADWAQIGKIKAAVGIPVIGNGDVTHPASANEMIRQTGCDGVMIGRAAMGNPWLLSAIASDWGHGGSSPHTRDWSDFRKTVLHHFEGFQERRPGVTGHLKAIIIWYTRGCPNASKLRPVVCAQERPADILKLFNRWMDDVMSMGLSFAALKVFGNNGAEECSSREISNTNSGLAQ